MSELQTKLNDDTKKPIRSSDICSLRFLMLLFCCLLMIGGYYCMDMPAAIEEPLENVICLIRHIISRPRDIPTSTQHTAFPTLSFHYSWGTWSIRLVFAYASSSLRAYLQVAKLYLPYQHIYPLFTLDWWAGLYLESGMKTSVWLKAPCCPNGS